jgi:Ca2+-binding RTX toxin-like protein
MTLSWLDRLLKRESGPVSRTGRKKFCGNRFVPNLEALGDRIVPTITATFNPTAGQLTVLGDEFDNLITVSRDAAGTILVNNGQVSIAGGTPTVDNTSPITVLGLGGNDRLELDEANGALPRAVVAGAQGNDTLIGGSANDLLVGGPGSDVALMGAGDDTFIWNPGDGSDTVEGQAGHDNMAFNDSHVGRENIDLSANGSRLRLFRDIGNVTMDVNGLEQVDVTSRGGAATLTVNDLSGTDVTQVNLNLLGGVLADTVIINGTAGDDLITVAGDASGATVLGLAAQVNITGPAAPNDRLTVNARAGDDQVDASGLSADAIQLTADGGDGDDVLIGSPGNDTLLGGTGDDVLLGNGGMNVLDGGPGDNILMP